jgi:hypothetical protein
MQRSNMQAELAFISCIFVAHKNSRISGFMNSVICIITGDNLPAKCCHPDPLEPSKEVSHNGVKMGDHQRLKSGTWGVTDNDTTVII